MPSKLRIVNVLIVISIIFTGFMLLNAFNAGFRMGDYIHHSRSGTNSGFDESTQLQANHSYKVQVTMSDYDEHEAHVEGSMQVYLDGELVQSVSLIGYDWPDDDEDAHATDTESVWLYPESTSELRVIVHMEIGDEWSYVLFEDLPQELENQALIYGISGIVGMIAFLCLILLHLKYYEKSHWKSQAKANATPKSDELDESLEEDLGVEYYD